MSYLNNNQTQYIEKMMREKFWFFVQSVMPPEWYDEKFHREFCEFLQDGGNQKLIILPRTHLKTTIAATLYPLWRSSCDTSLRTLVTSNTSPNAEKTVHQIRAIVEANQLYQAFFPECIPSFNKVRWSDRCACLNRKEDYPEGTFESAGVGANIIRRHFNCIIEDDTVAPKKDDLTGEECMPSQDDIEQAIGFHRLTPPLLINENDEQLVIGTRWADYDHIGWIMENEKYAIFDRPAITEGKSLYKRFSLNRLDSIRIAMGVYLFNSLYLNKPQAREFMIFKPDWTKYYEEGEVPIEGDTVITVDPADPPTGKKTQDYTAVVSCKHTKKGIYVIRYVKDRLTDKQVIDTSLRMAEGDGARVVRVEIDRYAHLQYGFKEAMNKNQKWFSIDAVKTRGRQKEGRIRQRLQPLFENGIIYIKRGMRELEEELYSFPNGAHDDLLDALAWQVEGIYPTEFEPPQKIERKKGILFVEMLKTLERRGNPKNYPFDRQLGGLVGTFNN